MATNNAAEMIPRIAIKGTLGVSGPLNSDYEALINKPQINGNELMGDKTNEELGIPTELADLIDDSTHRVVTDTQIGEWNAKSDFSGSYNDLTDVPDDLVEDANYVHTDNNFTNTEKSKLASIESGAEVNVQSDWSQTDTDADDYIKNKPQNLVQDTAYVHTDNNFTTNEKNKLSGIAANAEVNVQADWNETDTSSDAYIQNKPAIPAAQVNSDWNASSGVAEILHKPTLGTAAAKDYTGSVMENSTDLVESGAVKTAIDNAISSVYKPAGNKACAELVSTLLVAANLGNVYNMTDDGVTTADFVEGAGKPIEAGDNVVIVDIGSSVYKFDLLSGMVDLSNYVQKSSTSGLIKNDGTIDQTAYAKQNEMSVSTSGDQTTIQLKNGTTATVINAHQDISGKANKSEMTVTPGTGSDADKTTIQLKSGTDATVLTQHQDISGKVDKEQGKGLSTNDYTTVDKEKLAAISTEANKVTASETNGNIQIDGTETTVYDDTELQGAVSDLEDDIEEIQGEITTETATIEGNPLNFSTKSAQNAKSTILSLEPVQDLHGYDKPWVGGAGKNKCPVDSGDFIPIATWISLTNANASTIANCTKVSLKAGSYTVTITHNTNFNTLQIFDSNSSLLVNTSQDVDRFTLSSDDDVYIRVKVNDAGSTVKLTFKIQIEQGSDSTTWNPYENICPISGRTEIGILGCGKNLYIGSPSFDGYTNIENWTQDSSTHNGHKVYKRQSAWSGMFKYITLPVGTYTFSCYAKADDNSHACGIYILDGNTTATITRPTYSEFVISNTWNRYSYTFNVTSAGTVALRFESKTSSDSNYIYISEYQLEKGNQATDFEPYTKSNDLTISLGQTVYGGTLDVENGVLVVDRGFETFDGNVDEQWGLDNDGRRVYISQTDADVTVTNSALSDKFPSVTAAQTYQRVYGVSLGIKNGGKVIQIANGQTMVLEDWKTWLASNNVQVCYPLATPITINLTPHQISLLKGVNNISTDGDRITMTYRDGSVATLGDLTSAVDELDSKIDESKILTDTATGDKYILVVTNGVLSVEQISN